MKYIHHLGWVGEFVSNSGVVTVFLRAFPVCVHVCVCVREREKETDYERMQMNFRFTELLEVFNSLKHVSFQKTFHH